jgi:hypothetical protein
MLKVKAGSTSVLMDNFYQNTARYIPDDRNNHSCSGKNLVSQTVQARDLQRPKF